MILAAMNAKALWYLTRGSGVVALLLLTTSVALGVLTTIRWSRERWPRFTVAGLHRNLTLLAIVFVAIHVATTILDGYAPVGIKDIFVPFVSRYRPVWLGLGAVAFDLLLALVVTSLLRARLGVRLWRGFHWLAYLSWPIALVHSLGTGSDARIPWMVAIGLGSVGVVVLAVLARVAFGGGAAGARLAAVAAALVVPAGIGVWYQSGPAQHGWAKRAGTPATILLRRATVPAARQTLVSSAFPASRFTASLNGTIHESRSGAGVLLIVIAGKLHGGPAGAVRVDLRGAPQGGGVVMDASGVSYVPRGTRTVYTGSVTALSGNQIESVVTASAGHRLQLSFALNIDLAGGTVTGSVLGVPA